MMKGRLFLSVALATILSSVQAAPCTSKVCNSDFANALGGPVDCCKYAYSGQGSRCSWGGTPVSFKLVGTCEASGLIYQELLPSNFQGPPSQANCRCKDALAGAGGFSSIGGADIQGKDLACDGNSFCKVCGPPSAVADRCKQGNKGGNCVAFTYDGSCGYLKYADGPWVSRAGFTAYTAQKPPTPVNGFTGYNNRDIPGKDLACDGNTYCKVCSSFQTITDKCAQMFKGGKCVAFTFDGSCAYLKYADSPYVSRPGYVTYSKAQAGH